MYQKAVPLVSSFYGVTDGVRAVTSGDSIDLGGKTLVFEETPNIHWPETMMTYVPEDKVFSHVMLLVRLEHTNMLLMMNSLKKNGIS